MGPEWWHMQADLIQPSAAGLYCPAGDFYIDPMRPVARAVVTHAHADHTRGGMGHYWCSREGEAITRQRVHADADISALDYDEPVDFGPVRVSLHPAGHILGSAQVRVAHADQVWVVSGDYKRGTDPTCTPFAPQACNVFITESTFALPVYRWQPTAEVVAEIYRWWQHNAANGQPSVLFCYALGKAQRVLAHLLQHSNKRVWLHGAMTHLVQAYRDAGVAMIDTEPVSKADRKYRFEQDLILAPPSAAGNTWMRRFPHHVSGFASGWMRIRGNRRRRGYDRGFILSDHADWPELLDTIDATGAERIIIHHGRGDALLRHLQEQGRQAEQFQTRVRAENDRSDTAPDED
jgi:putative mRNA 3-end processing factor